LATALPPNPLTPERLTGISTVIVVAGGYLHTVVLKSAGTVWVWDRTATAKSATTRQEIDWFPNGIDDLLNRRNPIGPRRFHLMPEGYSRP
jgi:hypothetical protein